MNHKALIILSSCLLLSGCISGRPKSDTYTDSAGKTTVIQSDKEMCVQSCNDDYSRCMDTDSAQDNGGVHGPAGMFGGGADCRNSLKNCLPTCKGM
jgi:hypothetical protein